jgi:hypothetical protein
MSENGPISPCMMNFTLPESQYFATQQVEFWGSHSCDYEDYCHLGYDAM